MTTAPAHRYSRTPTATVLLNWGLIESGTTLTLSWTRETDQEIAALDAWLDGESLRRSITWHARGGPGGYLRWGWRPGETFTGSGLLRAICKAAGVSPYHWRGGGESFESPKCLILPGGVSLHDLRAYVDTATGRTART
ncbi:hypothetical protein [Streptomyces sp. NPDC101150]|uniref:hypothetical protein n=1 Tax=Streptomyces sp. NPDC101150 TaxID=3366114 RepID=UPI00381FF63A